MLKTISLIILSVVCTQAFELKSWYLGNIDNTNYNLKNTKEISKYTSKNFDAMCLQGINGEEAIKSISSNKQYLANLDSKLAFLVKNSYKDTELITYEDPNNIFFNKPQILLLKDVDLTLINYLASDDPEQRLKEIKEINNIYFSLKEKFNISNKRILTCGNFKENYGFVKREISDLYSIANNGGTVVDPKFGYSNYDYDHIISLHDLKATPDETLLQNNNDYKKFIDEISPHIPINLKL